MRKKPTKEQLKQVDESICVMLNYLVSRCDGAFAFDRSGFNKQDVLIGRSLAKWGAYHGSYSDKQRATARRMIYRYRNQLTKAGFNVRFVIGHK